MKWIVFFQNANDFVQYVTDEMQSYSVLSYKKFLPFLMSLNPINSTDLRSELDRFQTVFVNCETREWKVIEDESADVPTTFEEMLKLNPSEQELKEKEKDLKLNKAHEFVNNFNKNKEKHGFNKFIRSGRRVLPF